MTAVTQWREAGSGKHWAPVALPEPPRHSHVSKSVKPSRDGVGPALEEWMQSLTVASTHDGE
jgi:hypothetical protein